MTSRASGPAAARQDVVVLLESGVPRGKQEVKGA